MTRESNKNSFCFHNDELSAHREGSSIDNQHFLWRLQHPRKAGGDGGDAGTGRRPSVGTVFGDGLGSKARNPRPSAFNIVPSNSEGTPTVTPFP